MSESTGTPAPAPAPAPDAVSPPANTQPQLTLSEAGRLLRQQRSGEMRAAPPMVKSEAPSPSPPPQADASKLTPLDLALGVPGVAPPEGGGVPPPAPANDATAGLEIEGRRYTAAELREHVLKASDYTQKTQELARGRRELEAERGRIEQQAQALGMVLPMIQPELANLQQKLNQTTRPPDPAMIKTNPQQYLEDRAAWEQAIDETNRLANITQVQTQAQAVAMAQQVAAANEELAKEYPFWADPGQRLAAQQQIVEWAVGKGGFNRAELNGLTNARYLRTMMKAMAFDKWADSAKTSAPMQIGQPARGQVPPPAPTQRVAAASDAFSAKPSVLNAAALLRARRANGST